MSGPPSLDFGGEPNSALERVGARDCFGRELFVLGLPSLASLSEVELPASRFACVVACDVEGVRRDVLLAFARGLIERGAVVHTGERLDEALDFLFRDALPAPAWDADCRAAVAISVGHPEWTSRMRDWLDGAGAGETGPEELG